MPEMLLALNLNILIYEVKNHETIISTVANVLWSGALQKKGA